MAKFDTLYPDINAYCFEINDLIKTNKMRTCCVCEEKTNYIHLGHAAPVCSEECLKELDEQYEQCHVNRSEKTFWEWHPEFNEWKCHFCHWTIGEQLFGSHPDSHGYNYCPHCGTEMTEPIIGTMYKGD